ERRFICCSQFCARQNLERIVPGEAAIRRRSFLAAGFHIRFCSQAFMSMTKGESIRIMIADDHPVVREGLVASLNRVPDMTVVCEAATGQEALDLFSRHVPDVALVDLVCRLLLEKKKN